MVGKKIVRRLSYTLLSLYGMINIFPILWMLSTAFKTRKQTFLIPPVWIPSPIVLENFISIFRDLPFGSFIKNTALITVSVLIFQLVFGTFSAYAFARMRFPGRHFLFLLLLSSLMIPQAVTMIPQYIILTKIGWINTYQGVIVPQIFANVFGIFLMRQYFLGIPKDFEEAAKIDGAGILRTFLYIILPQVRPALVTVAVLSFMKAWNNFLWPLIVINSTEKMVLSVGLGLLLGQFVSDWPSIMAGATIALAPILLLYILAQRYFIESVHMSGFK